MPGGPGDARGWPLSRTGSALDEIATRAEPARALTALREQAGLTVGDLARQLDLPPATLGGYLGGRHLPGPTQKDRFVGILRACGVDEAGEVAAWRSSSGRPARRGEDLGASGRRRGGRAARRA